MWKAIASIVFVGGFFALALTLTDEGTIDDFGHIPADDSASAPEPPNTDLPVEDQQFVCRAALSELRARPVETISAALDELGLVRLEYIAEEGGLPWRVACRIDGDTVAMAHVLEDGSLGPWQLGTGFETITFALDESAATITRVLGEAAPIVGTIPRSSD